MIKKLYFLTFISILIANFSYAENANKTKMFESCADQLFVAQFGNQLEDYLLLSVKTKIDQILEGIANHAETNPDWSKLC